MRWEFSVAAAQEANSMKIMNDSLEFNLALVTETVKTARYAPYECHSDE